MLKETFLQFFGVEQTHIGHTEKLVSALGGFLGIYMVFYTSTYFLHGTSSYLILASMGSSAVLLFAVPHGPLSQPWSLVGGHIISAIIGVSCAKFIPDIFIAGSVAVGASIGTMYYLRCIHPPGGATTLAAVIASDEMQQLGYQFVLTPVLVNVMAILSVAVTFNYLFKWRRYPAYLTQKQAVTQKVKSDNRYGEITHEDFVFALSEFESFIDISENDLLRIYDLVTQRHQSKNIQHHELKHGHYYSNGEYGEAWSVRQIVDWADTNNDGEEKLIYKIIAGSNRRNSGVLTKNEFSRWAKHEVVRDEDNWLRVDESK